MAYMNQQRKAERMPAIKAALNKYGMKGTVRVRDYSTLVVNIKKGKLDFEGHYQINPYHYKSHFQDNPKLVRFLDELTAAMYGADYYDRSDAMVDYFDTSHYISINMGDWNKNYEKIA